MAIFSSRQSTHLFEVLVYAGADLTIFQDISGVCLIFVLTVPYIFRKCCTVCIFLHTVQYSTFEICTQ